MKPLIAALALALGAPALAAPATSAPGREALTIAYEKYTLPNGLEVILSRDSRLPVVGLSVWYHVGAFNEQPGRTGFAHLFEHMMFQGSKHVPDDAHIGLLERIGGSDVNGTTNFDRTNYLETVPSNHLETALWLESDRMGFLLDTLTEQKLRTQQEVVKNERRQRTETQPYGLAREKLWKALFPAPHPYHGVVIGSMEDLNAATVEDVKAFFRTWYTPANATLAVVGDFDPEQARALIQKYFGSLEGAPRPAQPQVAPVQLTEQVVIQHQERLAPLPAVSLAWHGPAVYQPEEAATQVLATVLGSGKTSRLYQRLVLEKQLAQSVSASHLGLGAQSVFSVDAVARPGVTPEALLREVDAVLAEVRTGGVTAQELERARTRYETGLLSGLQSVGGMRGKAEVLQDYNHFLGDPGWLQNDLARYDAVTPAQVQQAARAVLRPEARVVLISTPAPAPTAAASQEGKK